MSNRSNESTPPKVILTYGTFDLFHVGHLNLLRKLKTLADVVVVGISTDEFNALKGKDTIIPYEERARIVGALKYVDRVFPEYSWDQKRADIAREQAAVFAMGDDWVGAFDDLADCCEVLYVPRTKDVSTANLKTALVQHIVASRINEIAMASQRLISLIGDLRDVSAGTSGPVRDPAHIRWPFGKGAGH